jgi:hypothetical protein
MCRRRFNSAVIGLGMLPMAETDSDPFMKSSSIFWDTVAEEL